MQCKFFNPEAGNKFRANWKSDRIWLSWAYNRWTPQSDSTYPKDFKKYLVPSELCVDWKGFCWLIYWSLCRPLILQTSEIAKKSNLYNSKSKYNAHTYPLFRSLNILKVNDIFMLNILKMYYKYQKKSLPSYTANMFSVATCASNYNSYKC